MSDKDVSYIDQNGILMNTSFYTNKSILVVDDLKLNYLIIKKTLEKFSMQINFIQDPRLALDEIKKNKPDLILLDYEMPFINGPELCKLIKSDDFCKSIPIVFFTSSSAAETITSAFAAGADDYLNKPVCEPELLSRLSRIFQNLDLSRKLQDKYEEQVSLSRLLSHDLNNYISIFKTSLSLLKKNIDSASKNEVSTQKNLERLHNTINKMADLVLNVRNMQAIEDKKIDLNLLPTDVGDLITETVSNFQEKIDEKKLKINFDMQALGQNSAQSKVVLLERVSALNSVFGNVLSNAVKFSHEGGAIDIAYRDQNDRLQIEIRDHGVGMPDDLVKKIFSKTEKTTRAGTKNETGTGFGMPLVKLFMEKYGGSIDIQSKSEEQHPDDHGTTICLEFKKAA